MQDRADLPSADQSEPQNSAVANTSPLIESTSSALSWPVASASSAAALAVASAMASAMALIHESISSGVSAHMKHSSPLSLSLIHI